MTSNRFEALEEQTHILQELATTFPRESRQYIAIQNAAFALVFAISEHYDSFVHYINTSQEELSAEQREHLKKLGL